MCISLLRHYLLSFGSRIQDGSFHDRDLMGKATLAGMIVVTAPTLIANLFSEGHSLLTVTTLNSQCCQVAGDQNGQITKLELSSFAQH